MLYVARDKRIPQRHDLGSVLCLRALELMPPGTIKVHECRPQERRASWLAGTPTLALEGGEVLRGHQALEHLQRLAVQLAETRGGGTGNIVSGGGISTGNHAPRSASRPQAPTVSARVTEDSTFDSIDDTGLWDVAPVEEDTDTGSRKLTQDDMSRIIRMRDEHRMEGSTDRPAPEPVKD